MFKVRHRPSGEETIEPPLSLNAGIHRSTARFFSNRRKYGDKDSFLHPSNAGTNLRPLSHLTVEGSKGLEHRTIRADRRHGTHIHFGL